MQRERETNKKQREWNSEKDTQEEREGRDVNQLILQTLATPGLAQAKARNWNSTQVSHVGGRNPTTPAFNCSLQGLQEQAPEVRDRAGIKPGHTDMGCGDHHG